MGYKEPLRSLEKESNKDTRLIIVLVLWYFVFIFIIVWWITFFLYLFLPFLWWRSGLLENLVRMSRCTTGRPSSVPCRPLPLRTSALCWCVTWSRHFLKETLSTEIIFRSFYILIMPIIWILFYFLHQKCLDLSWSDCRYLPSSTWRHGANLNVSVGSQTVTAAWQRASSLRNSLSAATGTVWARAIRRPPLPSPQGGCPVRRELWASLTNHFSIEQGWGPWAGFY